jgi:uncharacterized sporulation protein YeaH/YhbH (DUF444 family)
VTHIIDRRLNPRDKTINNRKRFIDLHKSQVKKAVKKLLEDGDVDITKSNRKVNVNPTTEPTFQRDGKTGDKEYVLPGNKEFVTGDQIHKPKQGEGGGAGKGEGSPDGEGEHDFEFNLTYDEFMEFVFDEFELPDFVKKQLKSVQQYETINAGFKSEGNPSQLDLIRSMKNSIGRRIGLRRPKTQEMLDLEAKIKSGLGGEKLRAQWIAELEEMERRRKAIPWIDPFDIRYRNQVKSPKPHTQAVMFCIMDVSYSMQEAERDIAKRFFMLMNLFLQRKYNNVKVEFISHHAAAKLCDEEEFFRGKDTGGTVVSTALELCLQTIKQKYKPDDWNIYIAQASDGDNAHSDYELTQSLMNELADTAQYTAYVEILTDSMGMGSYSYSYERQLWKCYKELIMRRMDKKLAMQQVNDKAAATNTSMGKCNDKTIIRSWGRLDIRFDS